MSYKRAGRRDKAREYLQKILDEHPGTDYAARARKELARL
jgi:TolA-binding protein